MPSLSSYPHQKLIACLAASVAAPAFLSSSLAGAATDGRLGSMSTGTVAIRVTKASVVRVSGIRDTRANTDVDADKAMDICVFSSNGRYQVTSYTDGGAPSGFALRGLGSARGRSLPFRVYWNETPHTNAGEVVMQPGVTLEGLHLGERANPDCGGGSTARMRIEMPTSNADSPDAGGFAAQLTLVLSPV